jgi:hypothetical protein
MNDVCDFHLQIQYIHLPVVVLLLLLPFSFFNRGLTN